MGTRKKKKEKEGGASAHGKEGEALASSAAAMAHSTYYARIQGRLPTTRKALERPPGGTTAVVNQALLAPRDASEQLCTPYCNAVPVMRWRLRPSPSRGWTNLDSPLPKNYPIASRRLLRCR